MANRRKYPWNDWLKRKRLKLVQGVDFECALHGMAQQVRTQAAARNKRVSIEIDSDTLLIEITSKRKGSN